MAETKIRGSEYTVFRLVGSGEGVMRHGDMLHFYDVTSIGYPSLAIPGVPTGTFGGSKYTPEDISGYSFDIHLEFFVGVHLSFGFEWASWLELPHFTGKNAGAGSFGLNAGVSVSASKTTILGPYGPDQKPMPTSDVSGILIDYTTNPFILKNPDAVLSIEQFNDYTDPFAQFGPVGLSGVNFSGVNSDSLTYPYLWEYDSGVPGIGISYSGWAWRATVIISMCTEGTIFPMTLV